MEDLGSDLRPSNHSPPKPTVAVASPASSRTTITNTVDPTDDLLAAWQIPPSTHAHILHTSILPVELHPFLPSKASSPNNNNSNDNDNDNTKPLAILVLGQTGAGKTRLAPPLFRAMQQQQQQLSSSSPNKGRPLHLIADTFKTYHPFYATALATAPHLASRLASHDAAEWLVEVCAAAARERVQHVLVETACRCCRGQEGKGKGGEGYFRRLVRVFCDEGYAIRVAVLAVPAALSRLGILVRYYKRLPEAGSRGLPVRLTPRSVHDLSFEGLAEAVRWLGTRSSSSEEKGKAEGEEGVVELERVVVLRRNGRVVYDSNRKGVDDNGRWTKKKKGDDGGALQALEAGRMALSVEERKAAEEDIQMLKGLGDARVMKEVDEIQGLVDELGVAEDAASQDMLQFDVEEFVSNGGELETE